MQKITHKQVMFVCDFFFARCSGIAPWPMPEAAGAYYFVFYELSRLR